MPKVDWQLINGTNILIMLLIGFVMIMFGFSLNNLFLFLAGIIVGIYMALIGVEEEQRQQKLEEQAREEKKNG
jgi:hypothetical protein